jgi:hypothetical protein
MPVPTGAITANFLMKNDCGNACRQFKTFK